MVTAPSAAGAGTGQAVLDELNADRAPQARFTKLAEHRYGSDTIEQFRLGNGLTVLVWEDHRAPVFAYQTWFHVGSRHERAPRTGIAHLFEHLMFKATKNLKDGEFDQIMEAKGAQTNASTWVDWTYYREKLPAGNLDLVARLESDRMENMLLNETQLESERDVVKNERLLRVENDPDGKLYEVLYEVAFDAHPYGQPTIGWMADIEAITLEDCLEFYRTYYSPSNATIVVVGDVETRTLLKEIADHYGHIEGQPVPTEQRVVEPPQTEPKRRELELPVAADKAIYAWHGPASTDPDHAALEVLNEILIGGESSLLYRRLKMELELASSVGGWVPSWHQPGLYELAIAMRPGKSLADAEAELERVLEQVLAAPVAERELTKAKNGIEASFLRSIADTTARARGLGNAAITAGDFRHFFETVELIRRVTVDDVLAVARKVLVPTNRSVVIARPAPDKP